MHAPARPRCLAPPSYRARREALPLPLEELLPLVVMPLPLPLLQPLVVAPLLRGERERVGPYSSRCVRGALIQRLLAAVLQEEKSPVQVLLPLLPLSSRRAASLPGSLKPSGSLLLRLPVQAWPGYDLCGSACSAWGLLQLPLPLLPDCCSSC